MNSSRTHDDAAFRQFSRDLDSLRPVSAPRRETLARRAACGDPAARRELAACSLRLVLSIARDHRAQLTLSEAVQEGVLGLMKAIESYDPGRARFSTHATLQIRWAVLAAARTDRRAPSPGAWRDPE